MILIQFHFGAAAKTAARLLKIWILPQSYLSSNLTMTLSKLQDDNRFQVGGLVWKASPWQLSVAAMASSRRICSVLAWQVCSPVQSVLIIITYHKAQILYGVFAAKISYWYFWKLRWCSRNVKIPHLIPPLDPFPCSLINDCMPWTLHPVLNMQVDAEVLGRTQMLILFMIFMHGHFPLHCTLIVSLLQQKLYKYSLVAIDHLFNPFLYAVVGSRSKLQLDACMLCPYGSGFMHIFIDQLESDYKECEHKSWIS